MSQVMQLLLILIVWSTACYFGAVDVRAIAVPLFGITVIGIHILLPGSKSQLGRPIAKPILTLLALIAVAVVILVSLAPSAVPAWWTGIRPYFFTLLWGALPLLIAVRRGNVLR